VGEGVGYGYAAIETIKSIQRAGVRVDWQPDNTGDPSLNKVLINFIQPDYYHGLPSQFKIGYTPWESTEMRDDWVPKMQEMDEIWTTSTFCKDIFEKYKVNDIIRVVPHGIDQEIWKIEDRYVSDKFIFFHVGAPTQRKGGQKVVNAFLELFGDDENVWLVMKSNGVSDCRYTDKRGEFKNVKYHERIIVIEDNLDIYDLYTLYQKAHCLVYPTNGEGFGLIPFQGIATGLPTICTNATACADFAELSVPLKSSPTQGRGIHKGDWVEPDYDDLKKQMQYVFNNYDEAKDKTMKSANVIHSTQTWDHIGQQIIEILGDKIFEKS
jgi:glycosyltransferase involved in cell wall biosynthesis